MGYDDHARHAAPRRAAPRRADNDLRTKEKHMRKLNLATLCLILLSASHAADATPFNGTYSFHGTIMSFQVVTAPNTYTNALPTLSTRAMHGTWSFIGPPPYCVNDSDPNSCFNPNGGGECTAAGVAGLSWGSNYYLNPLQLFAFGATCWNGTFGLDRAPPGRITGQIDSENVTYDLYPDFIYMGINFTFTAPDRTPGKPVSEASVVNGSQWSGSGSFWYTHVGDFRTGDVIDGYEGTFKILPVPEPTPVALMLIGLIGLALSRRCRVSETAR